MMILILVGFWLVCNLVVAKEMTVEEMREDFINNQSKLGKICANTYYCLAWGLKKIAK